MPTPPVFDYDYLVIGSGFGGSVSACRLAEKGYSVGVVEMGKRYRKDDFAESNWDLKKFVWEPFFGMQGIFRMSIFKHAWVLSGVGVGGGSLVYANTSLEPPATVWDHPRWNRLEDWPRIMPRFYAEAKRMLGVTTNPYLGKADTLLKDAADAQGFGESFYPTQVAVYFGDEPGEVHADPFFDGEGPERKSCVRCGGCMVGCRHGAKNSLDYNYLWFAEKRGAKVMPETKVVDVRPIGAADGAADGTSGYEVTVEHATRRFRKNRRVLRARGVVLSAGVLGTVKLLLEAKRSGSLPRVSDALGQYVRTNSESIIGVRFTDPDVDITDGIAIGSGIYLDAHTHVEAVRYNRGSDVMGLTATLMAHGKPGPARVFAWLGALLRRPVIFLKMANPRGFGQQALILLVMQSLDSHLQMRLGRRWWWPFTRSLVTDGPPVPTYIPQANDFAEKMAAHLGGTALTAVTEILLNIPTTAHILGGAAMGADPSEGVIDARNRVFGYENLLVCDGSMIGANLGVNPSLTITALTEHAMSHIPEAAAAPWRAGETEARGDGAAGDGQDAAVPTLARRAA